MQEQIQLIVGLGNPGQNYAATRHNVGVWFAEILAEECSAQFNPQSKFFGRIARIRLNHNDYWLLVPTTYMNKSGLAVQAMANYYKIPPEAMLIIHDELDFSPGTVRFKQDGGHGGHNGLRDIIQHLQVNHFHRLRIGIGHPGHRDQVSDYVLNRPSKKDHDLIINSIHSAQLVLPAFLEGNYQLAIQQLHNRTK